jgi:hypothetical protein
LLLLNELAVLLSLPLLAWAAFVTGGGGGCCAAPYPPLVPAGGSFEEPDDDGDPGGDEDDATWISPSPLTRFIIGLSSTVQVCIAYGRGRSDAMYMGIGAVRTHDVLSAAICVLCQRTCAGSQEPRTACLDALTSCIHPVC